jgi:pimeloyl-ACP methyl ester carboxylesterase
VLAAAAAPSLVAKPGFPQGASVDVVSNIIATTYRDRPQMLRNFGDIFFHTRVSQALSDWLFDMGLQAASWSTIAISNQWLVEEMFDDLPKIHIPTLIMHGVYDQVCPYALGEALHAGISGSRLITFENSGHGLFYDEMDKFNYELTNFV